MSVSHVQPIGAGSDNLNNPYTQSSWQGSEEKHNQTCKDVNEIGIQCMIPHGDAILLSFTDPAPAKIFDKKGIAPRGIMQSETLIFNENDASIRAPNVVCSLEASQ